MKLEDQVCSLEQSQRLKKLGVNLKSYFVWAKRATYLSWEVIDRSDCLSVVPPFNAYTVAELLFLLHKYSNWEMIDLRDNQAEYVADILIKEIEGGNINVSDLSLQ